VRKIHKRQQLFHNMELKILSPMPFYQKCIIQKAKGSERIPQIITTRIPILLVTEKFLLEKASNINFGELSQVLQCCIKRMSAVCVCVCIKKTNKLKKRNKRKKLQLKVFVFTCYNVSCGVRKNIELKQANNKQNTTNNKHQTANNK